MKYLSRTNITALVTVVTVIAVGNALARKPVEATSHTQAEPAKITVPISVLQSLPTPQPSAPPVIKNKPLIYAKSYVVIDNKQKYPLLAKDADVPVSIASTTKIMTAILTLENEPLNKIITVTKDTAWAEGSKIDMYVGEKLTVESLLYATMLNSANNAANTLATASGTVDEFVKKMNEKAKLLGLSNTTFKDPAGLDDTGQSTPRDLALLLDYALNNSVFRKLATTTKTTITSTDGRYQHELTSSNRLIKGDEALYLPASIGGKTGFTYEAGHCLIAAAEVGDTRYIAAILHTTYDTNDASAREARKLLTWASQQ